MGCNIRCQTANPFSPCRCSCGGVNHGLGCDIRTNGDYTDVIRKLFDLIFGDEDEEEQRPRPPVRTKRRGYYEKARPEVPKKKGRKVVGGRTGGGTPSPTKKRYIEVILYPLKEDDENPVTLKATNRGDYVVSLRQVGLTANGRTLVNEDMKPAARLGPGDSTVREIQTYWARRALLDLIDKSGGKVEITGFFFDSEGICWDSESLP